MPENIVREAQAAHLQDRAIDLNSNLDERSPPWREKLLQAGRLRSANFRLNFQ